MMLSVFHNNTLAGLTFEGFDFSNMSLIQHCFANDDEHASFIDCTFTQNSFLPFDASMTILRQMSFYEKKPAIFEIRFSSSYSFFHIMDFKTGIELYHAVLFLDNTSIIPFLSTMDTMMVSANQKYIVIYAANATTLNFFIYSVETKCLTTHKIPASLLSFIRFTFYEDDKLIALVDNKEIVFYNLKHAEQKRETIFFMMMKRFPNYI